MTIEYKILKNYLIATLLFFLTFSFGFLPIYFLPINTTILLILSFILLIFFALFQPIESLKNMKVFGWFLILLLWYTFHIFQSGQLQYMLVDFRLIYILSSATLFFTLYYSHLRNYVAHILFSAGLIYVIFTVYTFSIITSSTEQLGGFTNIFTSSGLDTTGKDLYQNYGFWFAILMLTSAELFKKVFKKNLFFSIIFSIIFLTSIIALLLIGARAAFLGAVIGLLYYFKNFDILRSIYIIIFILLFILSISFFFDDLILTLNRFSRLFSGLDDSSRIFRFTQALDLWSQDWKTILFGAGVKSYPIFIGSNFSGDYPHNIFLEALSELGLIGLILLLLIFYSVFKDKNIDPLMSSIAVCMIVIYSFTGGFVDLYNIFFFLGLSTKKNK